MIEVKKRQVEKSTNFHEVEINAISISSSVEEWKDRGNQGMKVGVNGMNVVWNQASLKAWENFDTKDPSQEHGKMQNYSPNLVASRRGEIQVKVRSRYKQTRGRNSRTNYWKFNVFLQEQTH